MVKIIRYVMNALVFCSFFFVLGTIGAAEIKHLPTESILIVFPAGIVAFIAFGISEFCRKIENR